MASSRQSLRPKASAERRAWDLLTRNFESELPPHLGVKIYAVSGTPPARGKFQIFEVVVAAIFARLRPDCDWEVTPNRADDGLDFIGKHQFLQYEPLDIEAAITVGGQCKKKEAARGRTKVGDVIGLVGSSLLRMAARHDPTFFVVALSARVEPALIADARETFEGQLKRHCHILDRVQLEGLIRDHLPLVVEILREARDSGTGLSDADVRDVVRYFESYQQTPPPDAVTVADLPPARAGEPFRVNLTVRSWLASAPGARLRWERPTASDPEALRLIGPVGVEHERGVELPADADDPIRSQLALELVADSVGKVALGEIVVWTDTNAKPVHRVELGAVQVSENMRPRFFGEPFKAASSRLDFEFGRARDGAVASVGVVGAGGSGKSRLADEFALERRRRGSGFVVARQAKTTDDPHRILAELFLGLAVEDLALEDPAGAVVCALEQYDSDLAGRAEPAIRSIFGTGSRTAAALTERNVRAALLLLLMARRRRAPLIVHLQDLHWCSADVLLLLEGVVWELKQILSAPGAGRRTLGSGILFVFEGRVHERQLGKGWTSEAFEALLQKLDCPTVACAPFGPTDRLKFISLLFESSHSAHRRVSDDLLELQGELVERINTTAGGSPFHSIEQVKLLRELRIIGRNPTTGLVYLIQPAPAELVLPDAVFESIRMRWNYLRAQTPELALLVWAAGLLEDRIPATLFRRLRQELAPEVAARDVDATEMLWTGDGRERDVVFRHENYFRSVRLFEVSDAERECVVRIYSDWFKETRSRDPADQFKWARVLLELPEPDTRRAHALLKSALRGARQRGDAPLAQRIFATSLELTWSEDAQTPLKTDAFLRRSDDELGLTRELLGSDRFQATRRLDDLEDRLNRRLTSGRARTARTLRALERRKLAAQVLRSQILFNDQEPARAADVAAATVREIRALGSGLASDGPIGWKPLEMEALHSHAVALALSGEIEASRATSAQAVDIARELPSPLSQHVINTYANIVLGVDPAGSESILREGLSKLGANAPVAIRHEAELNLSMALLLRAHGWGPDREDDAKELLVEADARLREVSVECKHLGRYPDAAAAALLLGIVSASLDAGEEVSWFAQAVAAAARGRQMETLWRAHINLATAIHGKGERTDDGVRDHARAALEILERTLSGYSHPDRSPRFRLVRSPLAQAVSFLIKAGDEGGLSALERYPGLREQFDDPVAGILRDDSGPHTKHEWLRVGDQHYVLY